MNKGVEKIFFSKNAKKRETENIEIWQILEFFCSKSQRFACYFYCQKLPHEVIDFLIDKCVPDGGYDVNGNVKEITDFLPNGLTAEKLQEIVKQNFNIKNLPPIAITDTEQKQIVFILKEFENQYNILEREINGLEEKLNSNEKKLKAIQETIQKALTDDLPKAIDLIHERIQEEITGNLILYPSIVNRIKKNTKPLWQEGLFKKEQI